MFDIFEPERVRHQQFKNCTVQCRTDELLFQAKHLIAYSDGANDLQIKFDLNCAIVLKCSAFKKTNFVASYGAVNSVHNEHKCSNLWGEFLYGIVHFCMSKEVLGTISELVTFAALINPTVPYTCKKIKCTGKAYGTVKCTRKAYGTVEFVDHSCIYCTNNPTVP